MNTTSPLPKLITFDGEARSGKGTIVQLVKDYLRDEAGHTVMLIDAGQVFRCLVVAATNRGVNLDDPLAIDAFLGDDTYAEECVGFVKAVYHMQKIDREAILYTNEVGVNSAKIGARPLSQAFKDNLLKKWLRDARSEGYDIVLLDGRALEEVGQALESEGLCEFIIGLYFKCQPLIGAMRTLGFADKSYDELEEIERTKVDGLIDEIEARNAADRERSVQPIVEPASAQHITLPESPSVAFDGARYMAVIDTSAKMHKSGMATTVISMIDTILAS